MNTTVSDMIKDTVIAHAKTAQVAYQTGHNEGYRIGYKDGIAAAQKLINEYLTDMRKPE